MKRSEINETKLIRNRWKKESLNGLYMYVIDANNNIIIGNRTCGMYKEEQFYYRIAHNTFMLNQFLATPTKTMKGGK